MFEIHITVSNMTDWYVFEETCYKLNIKPHMFYLYCPYGDTVFVETDILSAEIIHGTLQDAKNRMYQCEEIFKKHEIEVKRLKIETTSKTDEGVYYELHTTLKCNKSIKDNITYLLSNFDKHSYLSHNHDINDELIITNRIPFNEGHNNIAEKKFKEFTDIGYTVIKQRLEVAVFDNNLNHDNAWLGKYSPK